MHVVIDRFEGEFAVCEREDRTMVNIPRTKVPAGAREGDVLAIDSEAISIDRDETARRTMEIEALLKRIRK